MYNKSHHKRRNRSHKKRYNSDKNKSRHHKSHHKRPVSKTSFLSKVFDSFKALKYLPCPKCKKHDNKLVTKKVIYQWTKEETYDQFDSHENRMKTYVRNVPWARFKITRKCNKCGYVWSFEKDWKM